MFSGTLIVLSLIGLFWRGLNYSIDFEGGAQIAYPLQVQDVTVADIVDTMAQFGRPDAEVQIVNGDQVSIRTASLTGDPQTEGLGDALAKQAGITRDRHHRSRTSARRGAPRSRGRPSRGLIVVLIAIALYIAFRFERQDGGRRDDRARPRRRDHRRHLRAGRAGGHPRDRDRDPDDPRVSRSTTPS